MALKTTCSCLHQIHKTSFVFKRLVSGSRSPQAQAVFIEKTLEEPIIVVREEYNVDLIGPPNTLSNLRPIIRKILKNETVLQRKYRDTADATEKWNHEFWLKHNTNFLRLLKLEVEIIAKNLGKLKNFSSIEIIDRNRKKIISQKTLIECKTALKPMESNFEIEDQEIIDVLSARLEAAYQNIDFYENSSLYKEKEVYIKNHTSEAKPQLNADEMSEFYKDFLNKYWQTHVSYNFEWYGKNFNLLMLSLRVHIENLQSRILW